MHVPPLPVTTSAIASSVAIPAVYEAAMDTSGDYLQDNVPASDNVGGGSGSEVGDVCDSVEREGAWMPNRPVQVPNAPDVDEWSSSESDSSDSDHEQVCGPDVIND
jgi:hypothetical protein